MLKKFLIGAFFVAAFALVASSASADCTITTTLKVGSKGTEVSCLQTKVGATADGSFGPMTKASVMAYQASHGLSADGVVGPMSRAVLNAGGSVSGNFPAGCTSASGFSSVTGLACVSVSANTFAPAGCTSASGFSPVTGGACYAVNSVVAGCSAGALFSSTTGASCSGAVNPGTGALVGGAGNITLSSSSTDVETQVVTEATNTKVLSFKVQADGSDVSLTNLKVSLGNYDAPTGSNYRLDKYITGVSVWMGSTKVGSADVADFSKSGYVYSKNITLSNAIVRMGSAHKATFFVTVDTASTIDSADYSAKWNILADNIRYADATGMVATDSSTAQYPSTVTSANIQTENGGFTFTSLALSGDVKVVVSKDSTSPLAQSVTVSNTASTKDVLLTKFKIKATGSTASFDTLAITTALTTVGSDTYASIFSELNLKDSSGDTIATIDGSDLVAGTNTFTLFDTKTVADSTSGEVFSIYATLNSGADWTSGATLTTSFASFAPEDSNGGIIGDTGSAVGATQKFVFDVPTINKVGTPTLALYTAGHDAVASTYKATIKFNVTAPDSGAVYIPLDTFPSYGTTGVAGALYTITGGAVTSANVQYTGTDDVSSVTDADSFVIDAGTTQEFTLTIVQTGTNALGKMVMTGLWYRTTAPTTNNTNATTGFDGSTSPNHAITGLNIATGAVNETTGL